MNTIPPFFYQNQLPESPGTLILAEAASKHCIQVLRMKKSETLILTDGKGTKISAEITAPERKRCVVRVLEIEKEKQQANKLSVGIAFTKNKSRNEWFLEKATELGVAFIYPLLTERSEKERFNLSRYHQILVAAMLQSQQCFLPFLGEPRKLNSFLKEQKNAAGQQFIAHCLKDDKAPLLSQLQKGNDCLVLIGPEGDFSPGEIEDCLTSGFIPVTLGSRRLRTETAGLYVCTVFNAFHYA